MLPLLFSWGKYFTEPVPLNPIKEKKPISRMDKFDPNIYIIDCFFQIINNNQPGGAIFVEENPALMVESTTFLNCSTNSNNGGAISFQTKNSYSMVVYKTCATGCCCNIENIISEGQFLYSVVASGSKVFVDDSSIIKTIKESGEATNTLNLKYGKISLSNNNISGSKISNNPAGFYHTSETVTISRTTYSYNKATSGYGFSIEYQKKSIKSCNILGNKSPLFISHYSGAVDIYDSCFIGNEAPHIFHSDTTEKSVNLINCAIVDDISQDTCVTFSSKAKVSFINALHYLYTINCPIERNIVPIAEEKIISTPKCIQNDSLDKIKSAYAYKKIINFII